MIYEDETWLSTKEISKILDCTQRTVTNLLKRGKLSAERDTDGTYYINKSEFFRAYPNYMETDEGIVKRPPIIPEVQLGDEKLRHLLELLEERKQQNEFLMRQIDGFAEEKSKMLDAINNHTRLLEYKETGFSKKSLMKRLFNRN